MSYKSFNTFSEESLKDIINNYSTDHADESSGDGRPSHMIDPRKKDKAWILKNCKSIYNDFNRNCPDLFYNDRDKYSAILNYIQGNQNNDKYSERYDQNKAATQKNTSINHSKRPLNLISKYFRLIKNKLGDIQFDVTATPNNALARDHENEYRSKLETFMELKKVMEENGVTELREMLNSQGIDIPSDTDELEIQMQMSQPALMSMEIEMALSWINQLDRSEDKFTEADYNLVAYGACALHDYVDSQGIPRTENVDPRDLLVGFSNTEDFRDVSEIGKFRMITLNDIRKEDNNHNLSTEDLHDIARTFKGKYGNDSFNNYNIRGSRYYNDEDLFAKQRVLILDLYFYSFDEEVREAKNNKEGNKRVHKRDYNFKRGKEGEYETAHPDRKVYRTRIKNVYKCSWVVNSNYIFNFGLHRPTERTKSDPNDTPLPIKVQAPLIQDGRTVSIIEELLPIQDQANIAWQKLQEHIAHARPPGFVFDVDALKNAIEGLPGVWKDEKEVFNLMKKHNIIPSSNKDLAGVAQGARAFTELDGGLGSGANGFIELLNYNMTLMEQITGFSNVAAGADVQYTGKKTAELAVATADYAIRHLFDAKIKLYERHMQSKANLCMDAIANGSMFGFKKSFGYRTVKQISVNKSASLYDYNIKIQFRPNKAEWAEFKQRALTALNMPLDQGGIKSSQYARIEECENLKQARELLFLFDKQNTRETEQRASAMQEQKAMLDQQSAAAASEQRQQQLAMEIDAKAELAKIESDLRMAEADKKFLYDLELKKLDGLVKSDHIDKEGVIEREVNEIKAKHNMDRIKPSVTQTGGK